MTAVMLSRARQATTVGRDGSRAARGSLLYLGPFAVAAAIPLYGSGYVTAADAAFVFAWPMMLGAFRESLIRRLWLWAGIWALAQLISNLWNHSKLVSQIGTTGLVTAIMVTIMMWLHREIRIPVPSVLIALALGWLGSEMIVQQGSASANPWKYAFASPVTLLALAIAYRLSWGKRGLGIVLLTAAAISLSNESRLYMGVALIAFIVNVASRHTGKLSKLRRPKTLVVGALALVLGLYFAYPTIAVHGWLGQRAQIQQQHIELTGVNFLLANRPEAIQIAYLITQHPLLGIGSTGVVNQREADRALTLIDRYSQKLTPDTRLEFLGAANGFRGFAPHTQLLSAMLEGGLAVLPFWLFLIRRIFAGFYRLARGEDPMPALLLWLGPIALWDAWFSPFTGITYFSLAATLFVLLAPDSDGAVQSRRALLADRVKTDAA